MGPFQSKELFTDFDKNLPNVDGKVFVITGKLNDVCNDNE